MNERVLCVAAHPDDEALGCGGTLARHAADGDEVRVLFLADGETSRGIKALPNRNFMAHDAAKVLGIKTIDFLDYADQRLDQLALLDLTQAIERFAAAVRPTIVYTHWWGDLNLDHAIAAQATLTAFRPLPDSSVRAIYAFEVVSSTEWGTRPFEPNHFVNLDVMAGEKTAIGKKWEAINCYGKEIRDGPHARSGEAIDAHTQARGFQVGLWFAEAFMTMRTIR